MLVGCWLFQGESWWKRWAQCVGYFTACRKKRNPGRSWPDAKGRIKVHHKQLFYWYSWTPRHRQPISLRGQKNRYQRHCICQRSLCLLLAKPWWNKRGPECTRLVKNPCSIHNGSQKSALLKRLVCQYQPTTSQRISPMNTAMGMHMIVTIRTPNIEDIDALEQLFQWMRIHIWPLRPFDEF